jgi:RimJ/RimL family protein N-acetyltransferase
MYADSKIELQAHPSDNSNAAEGSGNQPPVGEMPIAWAFLGIDGGLATLHVEPEYRGQNLALHVSKEAMRRGMAKGGIWRDRDEEGETWVHTNVLASNVASRRVMEKLGGEIGWTCTWTVVEYGV